MGFFKLLFLKHVNVVVYSYFVDFDLAKISVSCHFAIDFPLEFLVRMAPLPSAGKWLPNFAVFQKVGLATSHTVLRDLDCWTHCGHP